MTNKNDGQRADSPSRQALPGPILRGVQKIKSYLHERCAQKERENAQDRASRRTANATVAIAVLTVAVVFVGGLQFLIFRDQLAVMQDQLTEMRSTGPQTDQIIESNKRLAEAASKQADAAIETVKTARDSLIASERAWVGPINAKSETGPEMEKELNITIQYQNTGREPALETIFDAEAFVASQAEDDAGTVSNRINEFITTCKLKWTPTRRAVVFPAGVATSFYEVTHQLDAGSIDQDVIDGTKSIFVDGCFVYKSAGGIHRSSFCYYFNATKKTKPSNWSICMAGNDAD